LAERLQAWKHAVGYLEDYITATEKVQRVHAKEYEKILKVRLPLTTLSVTCGKLIATRPFQILSERVTISIKA